MGKDDSLFHLRLNPDKEEEAKAIEILERAKLADIDFKGLVLPLILDMDDFNFESPLKLNHELLVTLEEAQNLIARLKNIGTIPTQASQPEQNKDTNQIDSEDPLMQGLNSVARPGRRRREK